MRERPVRRFEDVEELTTPHPLPNCVAECTKK
jgi:hypothetical protein